MTSLTAIPTHDLASHLAQIGLKATSQALDDFIARATKGRWSPRTILEELLRAEETDRAQRSLERRLRYSHVGRFKPMADFDWNWPEKIEREVIERAFTLDFIQEGRKLVRVF